MPFASAARSCVWQHRATTSEGRQHRLQIAAPDSSALGHATATTVVTKMPFLMQVFVLLFAPLLRLGFLGNHPFLDYYQNAPFTIQSLAWNASSQETPRMPFASAARSCVWQHRATTSEGRQHRLQIAAPDSSALGHATATTVVTKMPFLMQVFVLLFAPLLRLGFLGNHPFLDYYQNAPFTIQSLAWNASSQETPRMPFASAARSCVWQHRATTSEGRQHRLQIAAPDSSALGQATATTVVTKMPFLMQVFVLLFAPLLRLGFLGNHPFLDYYQNAPFTIQSLAWNASSQETPRMPFASAARSCVWQHRATTSEGRQHRLQIAAPDSSALGHATATTVVTKMPFLMQVFVLLFAPLLRLGFLGNHPFLDYYQNAPFTIQSLAWNASSQETPRMPFASAARSCVWQHRATTKYDSVVELQS
ncbi:hypothetical protein MRX96_045957 [Rhipicephalus microplus]